jgi:hypothetical protein
VAGWGAAIAAFGLLTASFPLALLCLAVAGGADVISAVLRASIVQFDTPDHLRGRLMSIHTLVVTSGPRLGDAEAAAVAAWPGRSSRWSPAACSACVGLAAVLRLFPQLLGYELHRGDPPAAASTPRSGRGAGQIEEPALSRRLLRCLS